MKENLRSTGESADTSPALAVRDLTVSLSLPAGKVAAVEGISFGIQPGQIIGMVGESGSGKSMTALAITRMLPPTARITGGSVIFAGQDLATASEKQMQRVRGGGIGMVFQDPLTSLNPLMPVGAQIEEVLRLHGAARSAATRRAVELLDQVGIRNPHQAAHARPHEFSGGMRQRVMIAIAIANNPTLLVADEPTTALDVTIQAEILHLITGLRDELGMAVLLITHDIALVEEVCDQVVVLYAGRVAETGGRAEVLASPRHPYTYQLMRAVPRLGLPHLERLPAIPGHLPDIAEQRSGGCLFMPRCEFAEDRCTTQPALRPKPGETKNHLAACWVTNDSSHQLTPASPITSPAAGAETGPARRLETAAGARPPLATGPVPPPVPPVLVIDSLVVDYTRGRARCRPHVPAVDSVNLAAHPGRTLGLVGESGSGKTSLARAALGLIPVTTGSVTVSGCDWRTASRAQRARMRGDIQLIFQDPYASLNPRWRVSQILGEPLRSRPPQRRGDPGKLLARVGLPARFLDRYPGELSGGQRQRVGIARALAVQPKIIVADEPVSALDVSVQAQIINLLTGLRKEFGLGLVFVAHDLAVIRHVSDDLLVMYLGRVVESGTAAEVFARPRHPYTAVLMSSAPGRAPAGQAQTAWATALSAAAAPPIDLIRGCRFRNRCPIGPLVHPGRTICEQTDPALEGHEGAHRSACHFSDDVPTVLT